MTVPGIASGFNLMMLLWCGVCHKLLPGLCLLFFAVVVVCLFVFTTNDFAHVDWPIADSDK